MSKINDLLILEQLMTTTVAPPVVTPPPVVDSGPVVLSRSGQITASGAGGGGGTDSGPVIFMRSGTIELDEDVVFATEMDLVIEDPVIDRAPTTVTASLQGASAAGQVNWFLDNVLIYTTVADSDGNLFHLSLPVETSPAGQHTLRATQVVTAGSKSASATFTINREPVKVPVDMGGDAAPIEVPRAIRPGTDVRRWVLQDLHPVTDGGIGSYVLPISPTTMSSPHFQRTTTSRRTTAKTGRFHVSETGRTAKEWTFSGYCPTEEMADKLMAFRHLNRRFYVIDHHNRAWITMFTDVDLVPRLRHSFNGELTDWGSDYTVTATLLSQDWRTPQ